MGGKKGQEQNRKYEKDRRDKFNEQFNELNKLLPDINSTVSKVTKADIISRTIHFLKDIQSKNEKLQIDFDNERNKISELQKKIAGLLQIIKELTKLLHKSNISFPTLLPADDLASFKEVYSKCKRKKTESIDENQKNKCGNTEGELSNTDSLDSISENEPKNIEKQLADSECETSFASLPSSQVIVPCSVPMVPNAQIMKIEPSSILGVNSSLIIPQGNLVTVNGLSNTLLNTVSHPTILLNKQVTMPTLIVMQNNAVSVCNGDQSMIQKTPKPIVPKLPNSTKTTFINKKPIPAVRLFKSLVLSKDRRSSSPIMKHRRIRRSKGILVKYPKRKPPTRYKKKTNLMKKCLDSQTLSHNKDKAISTEKTNNRTSFPSLNNCPRTENSFSENNEDISNLFDTQDIPNTSQFIDFFDPNSSRNLSSTRNNDDFERPFTNSISNCSLMNTQSKELSDKEPTSASICENNKDLTYTVPSMSSIPSSSVTNIRENNKDLTYMSAMPSLPSSSTNDSLLLKYIPSSNCPNSRPENHVSSSDKNSEKVLPPLSIQCNLSESTKSVSKDLQLTFDDKNKNYESSFDDLLTSLQVQAGSHNTDSISPTATFLLNFPIVSSSKNVDTEQEEDSNTGTTSSTTILQIGNVGSPTTLLFPNKNSKQVEKDDSFSFCGPQNLHLEIQGKKKDCKEASKDFFSLDIFSLNQVKSSCSKETPVAQNIAFYPASTTSTSTSTFPSYNMFTKYNEIPAVTSSYYSFCSQPFPPVTKSVDSTTDFNSWMPTLYNSDDIHKEKKRDKNRAIQNIFGITSGTPEKKKKMKTSTRPLVNWMTSPDLRTLPETSQTFNEVFTQSKDDTINANSFFNVPNVQSNSNFSTTYSSSDFFLDTQTFSESQLSNCKITYTDTPTSYSWSPSKSALPTVPLDNSNMIIPSTLPTLVGDLALGSNTVTYESPTKKYDMEKKQEPCKNYYKAQPYNASSFLSVNQLVDNNNKAMSNKNIPSKKNEICQYDARDKCYKENYHTNKSNENSKNNSNYPTNNCKELPKSQPKCRKDSISDRCLSKETKKDRLSQKSFRDYLSQNCLMNKEINPLGNKNSNYSAESLIGTNNQINSCSNNNYLSYDGTDYNNYSTNKRSEEVNSVTNVGYYSNTNYIYPNNFQTFNNYGLSNQYCNNYTSQIQPSGLQKKRDEHQSNKTDSDWFKDGYSSYSTAIVPSDFSSNQKDVNKQTFSNKYNYSQRSSTINTGMYNSYYQYSTPSNTFNSKSDCNFNSTYSFSQSSQTFSNTNHCQAPTYNNGKSNRAATNFNMSAIFPEINDKHCASNRVHPITNEKSDPKYGSNKVTINDIDYNYMNQPAVETNADIPPVYGSSSFQISHFTDFPQRKTHKLTTSNNQMPRAIRQFG